LAEVAIGAFIGVAVSAIAADLTMFTFAFMNFDKTARDCARAAAGQTTSAQATKAAQAQLTSHATDGYFCEQPQLVGNAVVTFQDWSAPPYNGSPPIISGSTPPTPQCAYVTVNVSEGIRLPIPIPFFGVNISQMVPGSVISITRAYTFPIIKTSYTPSSL
jgi:hypothetical protein